jgi:D-3-phosphoglycerate dehydrogenase
MGRIARKLISLAQPLFGRIVASDPYVTDADWPAGVERLDLDGVLETADVISLHAPLTEATRNMIDAGRLARMRPGAVLINVSRGGLIDEEALVQSLGAGHLFGAGLDVFTTEPPRPDSPLLTHPRVLLSPHSAYMSEESRLAYVRRPAENIVAWHRTGRPLTPVLEPERAAA